MVFLIQINIDYINIVISERKYHPQGHQKIKDKIWRNLSKNYQFLGPKSNKQKKITLKTQKNTNQPHYKFKAEQSTQR